MGPRPKGIPHPLSWVRRVDDVVWKHDALPEWGLTPARELDERELAFELARCAVDRNVSINTAAKLLGVGRQRAHRAINQLRDEVAPRRGIGQGPLTDSGIYKRLRGARKRSGRVCLAPGCDNTISPTKRVGTYACSGKCRKRIFDAGGRDAIIERSNRDDRERRVAEREAQRQTKLPAASPLVTRCAYCDRTFTGPSARTDFQLHQCDRPTSQQVAAGH